MNIGVPTPCSYCGRKIEAVVFPAYVRESGPAALGDTAVYDDAVCFNHPGKRAAVACDLCGRFMCNLCDLEVNNRHICPSCLEKGKRKKKIKTLDNHRTLYDSLALMVASLSSLPVFWFFWFISAPLVIFLTIRFWKAPTTIVGRTKIRFIIAMILSLVQIVALIAIIVAATR